MSDMIQLKSSSKDMGKTLNNEIEHHIREHAIRYYPETWARPPHVTFIKRVVLKASALLRFRLNSGTFERVIIAKVPAGHPAPQRLTQQTAPSTKWRLQYHALMTMHNYFESLADPKFGTIRPLDFLPQYVAILMEEDQAPSLRRLLVKAPHRCFRSESAGLDLAFGNAGSWLRAYHGMPCPQAQKYQGQCDDAITSIHTSTTFLGNTLGNESFFQRIAALTTDAARDLVPRDLPLGLHHGDYALRNILIGPDYRVTGLDTQAKWQTPVYDDIAYFMISLRTMWPRVLSQGLAFPSKHLRHYERHFLSGYFESDELPREPIRLYMIKVLLNKWANRTFHMHGTRQGWRAGPIALHQGLMNRFFRYLIEQLCHEPLC